MILYTSIFGVSALTLYYMIFTYRMREKLTCMVGMIIAMTIGMMSSVAIGTILGILLPDLVLSTIVSVLIGMLVGYWTGKPVSLMASIDGMLAGIMGGLMGAMLGAMITRPNTIVMFVDIIFLFVITVLIQMINEEVGTKNIKSGIGNDSFVIIVMGVAIVGLLFILENNKVVVTQEPSVHKHIHSTYVSNHTDNNNDKR